MAFEKNRRDRVETDGKNWRNKTGTEVRRNRDRSDEDIRKSRDRFNTENRRGRDSFDRDETGSRDNRDFQREENENLIKGRNPILEVLKSNRTVEKLYVQKGLSEGSIRMIISMAKDKNAAVTETEKRVLDEMAGDGGHQGVVAIVSPYTYSTVDEIINLAKEKGEDSFVIILDGIEDPHNLGSIIRSANVLGAHGVILPKRRSALITSTVVKSSAGAVEHTKVAKVTNINQTINELKEKGLWIIGTDMDGESCYKSNLTGPIAIVIGNEGTGISRLVKENCDLVVSIPVMGNIESLNASVAGGIVMYEIRRQRDSRK